MTARGDLLTGTARLVVEECCACHVLFGMPKELQDRALRQPRKVKFWCPNGHEQWYAGETPEDRLRRQLDGLGDRVRSLSASLIAEQDQRRAAERSAAARKGWITRMRKRQAAGVCPCCNRTFPNVAEHMFTKHPDHATEEGP